jgi:hypothetical protein
MPQDPSFNATARALRETTERLCAELVAPGGAPPAWNEFEWDIARAVATMQGVSGLLADRLRWSGPSEWRGFLQVQSEQCALRDQRIAQTIDAVDTVTARAGIPVVGLKGTALRAHRLFAPGARPMGDIDLLARAADLPALAAALARCGYVEEFTSRRHVVFDLPARSGAIEFGEHVDNSLKIEVHTCVADSLPASAVDITARLWPAAPRPGINTYRDVAALFLHLLLHAAGNMRAHALRLIQLWDIAALSHRLSADDWAALIGSPAPGDRPWWLWPPLSLAQRCTSVVVPESAQAVLESACPRRLARAAARYSLYEVSWSNLRIAAFPGIEWSRTPLEALRYARSRVAPGRAARSDLELMTRVQPLAQGSRWYDTSHLSRIVRWVFSRPRRVQTMYSIRAALANRAPRPG